MVVVQLLMFLHDVLHHVVGGLDPVLERVLFPTYLNSLMFFFRVFFSSFLSLHFTINTVPMFHLVCALLCITVETLDSA